MADQYQIQVKGHLDESWADWFDGFSLTHHDDGSTLLTGPVTDQAALHGILVKVRDLGLILLAVTHVPPGSSIQEAKDLPRWKDNVTRHYAIDWIRIIATLAVFMFHSGAAYSYGNWHLNNLEKSFAITVWNTWLLIWMMPIFFFISGASTYFALNKRSSTEFLRSRFQRLAIPLIFGVLVIVPPQVYLERFSRLQFTQSFVQFYPHYFEGWYLEIGGSGNFAWMGLHLWYLLLLFVLSIVMLPLFRWIGRGDEFRRRLIADTDKFGGLLLYAMPIALVEIAWGNVGVGGWNILTYPLFFLYGYLIFSRQDAGSILQRYAVPAFVGAVVTSALLLSTLFSSGPVAYGPYEWEWQALLHAFSGWFWIIAILGLAYRYLNFSHSLLKYSNEAVLPFYILHQTWVVILGFLINRLDTRVGLKYVFVLCASFLAILLTYEMIKRVPLLRLLFGMKLGAE